MLCRWFDYWGKIVKTWLCFCPSRNSRRSIKLDSKGDTKASKKLKPQSLKYTAARLHEKGVILEIEGLQTNQWVELLTTYTNISKADVKLPSEVCCFMLFYVGTVQQRFMMIEFYSCLKTRTIKFFLFKCWEEKVDLVSFPLMEREILWVLFRWQLSSIHTFYYPENHDLALCLSELRTRHWAEFPHISESLCFCKTKIRNTTISVTDCASFPTTMNIHMSFPSFRFKNVMFDISPTEEVGDFEVKAKFMGVEMEKVQLHFQVKLFHVCQVSSPPQKKH